IAIDPLNRYVSLTELLPHGATFKTRDVGQVITTDDTRFRPVDIKHGPDGAIYIADWVDAQLNHMTNAEGGIALDDGRIYRVRGASAKPGVAPFDLAQKSSPELVALLG